MLRTTLGQLLVNDALPPDLRDYSRVLDKKGLKDLANKIAEKHPDKYKDITKQLNDIGKEAAYISGGFSFGLRHLRTDPKYVVHREQIKSEVQKVLESDLSEEEKEQRIVLAVGGRNEKIEKEIYDDALADKNPLGMQVLTGSRGNPGNLRSLMGGDLLYTDHHDRIIPVPVLRSYSEGLKPAEYFAGSFGARRGMLDTKLAVRDTGFFCLSGNMPVLKTDGSFVRIENIEVGTEIVGADKTGKTFPVKVVRKFVNGFMPVWRFWFRRDDHAHRYTHVEATEDHKVLARVGDGEPEVVPLKLAEDSSFRAVCIGEDIWSDKTRTMSFVQKAFLGHVPTYDIEVDHPDHLFVLANGAIVSNSKQLNQVAHRLVVTALDEEKDQTLLTRGLPVPADDPDNVGALLAFPILGYPRNTVITPKILKELQARNIKKIVVRSPITGSPPGGGLYARDVGIRERGSLPPIGEQVGIAAAQAISEPVSQGGFASKHTGGVVGSARTTSGFKYINQMVQVPKTYSGGAAHAKTDGIVKKIEDAPAGGKYVYVNDVRHYVLQNLAPLVKVGDEVEAGDVLSEGLPNPGEVVAHKGIGEGRRYFIEAFRKVLKDSGVEAHRRNIEVVARGLIDHVSLTDEVGDYVPGDIVSYDLLEKGWKPRPGHKTVKTTSGALGKYLEKPVLHYTIGTRITKKVLDELRELGIDQVVVHDDPPPFEPAMIRALESLQYDPDWITRMLGSYLKKSLLQGVYRGAVSDAEGTSFVPALINPIEFGRRGKVRGYDPMLLSHPKFNVRPKEASSRKPASVLAIDDLSFSRPGSEKAKKPSSVLDIEDPIIEKSADDYTQALPGSHSLRRGGSYLAGGQTEPYRPPSSPNYLAQGAGSPVRPLTQPAQNLQQDNTNGVYSQPQLAQEDDERVYPWMRPVRNVQQTAYQTIRDWDPTAFTSGDLRMSPVETFTRMGADYLVSGASEKALTAAGKKLLSRTTPELASKMTEKALTTAGKKLIPGAVTKAVPGVGLVVGDVLSIAGLNPADDYFGKGMTLDDMAAESSLMGNILYDALRWDSDMGILERVAGTSLPTLTAVMSPVITIGGALRNLYKGHEARQDLEGVFERYLHNKHNQTNPDLHAVFRGLGNSPHDHWEKRDAAHRALDYALKTKQFDNPYLEAMMRDYHHQLKPVNWMESVNRALFTPVSRTFGR